jgi:hypothetical protein
MVDTIYSGLRLRAGRSAVAVADVDGDGWYDLVAGNATGGVKLYKQIRQVTAGLDGATASATSFALFPNPAVGTVYVRREVAGSAVSIRLMSATGQLVATAAWPAGERTATLDVGQLAAGVYLVEVAGVAGVEVQRLSVVR